MAVLSTKKLQICGLKKDRKAILEIIQRLESLELIPAKKGGTIFKKYDVSKEKAIFEKNADVIDNAISILDKLVPLKIGIFEKLDGKKPISNNDFIRTNDENKRILDIADNIVDSYKELEDSKSLIPKILTEIETLKPWESFELPLDFEGTQKTSCYIGSFTGNISKEELYEKIRVNTNNNGFIVNIDIISSSEEQTCVMLVCLKEDSRILYECLQKMDFSRASYISTVPAKKIDNLNKKISSIKHDIKKLEENIIAYKNERESLLMLSDYYSMRASKYGVINNIVQSQHVFVIRGYIVDSEIEKLKNALVGYDVTIEELDIGKKDNPPVSLKNNAFARPVEGVIESYSLPNKKEFDPTFITSLFYYILFGMMYSDAGYGILLIIISSLVLLKAKNIAPGTRKMMNMLRLCGIATTFWGFMFGSFFGDLIDVIGKEFVHNESIHLQPLWFNPVEDAMRMLGVALAIGGIHLIFGLCAKVYKELRNKDVKAAIYDGVFWIMFAGGCGVLLLTLPMVTEMFNIGTLTGIGASIARVVTLIGLVGVILTSGRESKSPVKRLLKGLYGAYGISGYLSDILSYSRILALGLATGVIATVFNSIGVMFNQMVGAGILGFIIFIIVFLIGHTLNFLINALGAYVHANRLQYVEFYGKFYDGGGRAFEPISENTKYYKVS